MLRFFPSGADEATVRGPVRLERLAATPAMLDRLEPVRFGLPALLGRIRAPPLVLHQRGDRAAAFANGEHYARHIPGARFVPLEGDTHFPWVGDWHAVVTPVLDFLRDGEA